MFLLHFDPVLRRGLKAATETNSRPQKSLRRLPFSHSLLQHRCCVCSVRSGPPERSEPCVPRDVSLELPHLCD